MISILAPAKINLMLHVTGRTVIKQRDYHHLQTLITFVDYGDVVAINESAKQDHLKITGQFANALRLENSNSIIQAKQWFYQYFGLPEIFFNLDLEKNLPIASGIGGGTSDAAAMIAALIMWHQINLSLLQKQQLVVASGALGADIPVCLSFQLGLGNTFWLDGSGVMELPQSIDVDEVLYLVLINPGILINTESVFKAIHNSFSFPIKMPSTITADSLITFLRHTSNDLQEPAIKVYPQTKYIKQSLQIIAGHERIIRQSGSGSTYFCLVENLSMANNLALHIRKYFSNCWVRSCKVAPLI